MAFYTDYPLYPTAIFSDANYPSQANDVDWVYDHLINALKEELQAVMAELGTLPRGDYVSVKARLDAAAVAPSYIDRGDPASWDFDEGDLTLDNTWRDLDLSGIVPAGAVAVNLHVSLKDDAVSSILYLRRKGVTLPYSGIKLWTIVANVLFGGDFVCACDASRKIQYIGDPADMTTVRIQINGWWK